MKKIIAFTIIILSVSVFSLFSSLLFIDYNSLYEKFLHNIKFNITKEQANNIVIKKFPIPYLFIESVKDNNIEIRDLEIKFSLLSLVKFKPEIKMLKVGQVKIGSNSEYFNFANHDKLISDLLINKAIGVNVEIKDFLIVDNGSVIINIKDFKLTDNGSLFSGNIENLGAAVGSFSQNNDEVTASLKFNSSDFGLNISEVYKNHQLQSGKLDLNIKSLSNFIIIAFPDLKNLLGRAHKTPFKVLCKLLPDDQSLKLQEILINGENIQGSGEVSISRNDKSSDQVNLYFSKIDLKSIDTNDLPENAKESNAFSRINFNNRTGKANITIDQILLDNDEINNMKVMLSLQNSKLSFDDFSGELKSGGAFRVKGMVTQNAYRSVFDGQVLINHNDLDVLAKNGRLEGAKTSKKTAFSLSGDLKFTLIDLYLQNILLKTDNATITGNLSSKFIGATPRVSALLKVSSIDLTNQEYPFISALKTYLKSLTENMKSEDYLNKFTPLRTLKYFANLDVTINELIYNSQSFGKVNLLMNASPGVLELNNLNVNNGNTYLNSSWKISTIGIKPKLEIDISDGAFNVNFLGPKEMLALRNKLLSDYSLDKVSFLINCHSLNLRQGDLALDKLSFSLENDSTLFKFSDVQANVLGGNLKASGSILLEPFTYNFVYAANSINLESLGKLLPSGYLTTPGVASMNGMITTNGDSMEKQLYNLYTKSTLAAKDLSLKNISIDNLAGKVSQSSYDPKDLDSDVKSALLTGETKVSNLKSEVELTNGIVALKNISFNTIYTAGTASAVFSVYDFNLNLSSILSFYIMEKVSGKGYETKSASQIELKASGTIFGPEKKADYNQLKEDIQSKRIGAPSRL
jgi:hypothetical protein